MDSFEKLHAVCFAELVPYVESFRDHQDTAPVFSMSQLCQLYTRRLADLGVENPIVRSTCLREKIVRAVPDIIPTMQGREYVLMFDKDMGEAIQKRVHMTLKLLTLPKLPS